MSEDAADVVTEAGQVELRARGKAERWIGSRWFGVGSRVASIVLAVGIGSVILGVNGFSPVEAYTGILIGSLGNKYAIADTLTRTTPLILTGLAVTMAFRAGLFNIGGEGQLLMGAVAAAIVGVVFPCESPILHVAVSLAAAMVVGAAWGAIAGVLKVHRGAHEVIVTIMMNYIGALFAGYLVNYPFKSGDWGVAQTELVRQTAQLPRLMKGSQLSIGLFIALGAVLLCAFILRRTIFGFELTATGHNPVAARTAGVRVGKVAIGAMALAGLLAGLGGGIEVLGVYRRFVNGFSPGVGYDGVAVALAANNSPFGVVLTALLFGVLRTGGAYLDRATVLPGDFATVIQGLVIVFAAAPKLLQYLFARRR